jgi:hypothetical protein
MLCVDNVSDDSGKHSRHGFIQAWPVAFFATVG